MKCLSVQQPWATALIEGYYHVATRYTEIKDIENRTWATNYRGPLLIHASMKVDMEGVEWLIDEGFRVDVQEISLGLIIGRVDLVDIVRNHKSLWAADDQFNWVTADPIKFKTPIPAKGKLGLWNYEGTIPDELL